MRGDKTLAEYGPRQAQFTCSAFTGLLTHHGIRILMDGKGLLEGRVHRAAMALDLKYKEVYLHAYESESESESESMSAGGQRQELADCGSRRRSSLGQV